MTARKTGRAFEPGWSGRSAARCGVALLAALSLSGCILLRHRSEEDTGTGGVEETASTTSATSTGTETETPVVVGTGTLDPLGGTVVTDAATIDAPAAALVRPIGLVVSTLSAPPGLPDGFTAVGPAIDVAIDDPTALNMPLRVTLHYDDQGLDDEGALLVLHHDEEGGYEPTTILEQDVDQNTITFDSRRFSPFVVTRYAPEGLPAAHVVNGFDPTVNGWKIPNFGKYFSQGGNCMGMSTIAVWFLQHRPAEHLHEKFPPEIARLVATRAQLAERGYWRQKGYGEFTYQQKLGATWTARQMKAALALDHPLVLLLLTAKEDAAHASIVYGYDQTGFYFEDVNFPDQTQKLPFDGVSFGTYGIFSKFGYVAEPSLGTNEDFEGLIQQAEQGFTSSADITIASPADGESIPAREALLSGSLSQSLLANGATDVMVFVKDQEQDVALDPAGGFQAKLPVGSGENTLVILAGNIANASSFYPKSATLIRTLYGDVPPADFLMTMHWNQGASDVDAVVTQPDGESAWFSSHVTSSGTTLVFDNTAGYGPEFISLSTQDGGVVLPGAYRLYTHWYGVQDPAITLITGEVSVVLHEGTSQEKYKVFPFALSAHDALNSFPGGQGDDWFHVTDVDVEHGLFE